MFRVHAMDAHDRLDDRDHSNSGASAATNLPTSGRKRIYCGHCCEYVGYSTFYRHRYQFYDTHSKQWSKSQSANQLSVADSSESYSDSDTDPEVDIHESMSDMVQVDEGEALFGTTEVNHPQKMQAMIMCPSLVNQAARFINSHVHAEMTEQGHSSGEADLDKNMETDENTDTDEMQRSAEELVIFTSCILTLFTPLVAEKRIYAI